MPSRDWRGLDIEVDTTEPSENADVVDAVVSARGVIICLVSLVIQLFLHIRIEQVEVVDVVDLDLGSQSSTVAQEDGSSARGSTRWPRLRAGTCSRASVLLVPKVDCSGKVLPGTDILVLGVAFLPLFFPVVGHPSVEPIV